MSRLIPSKQTFSRDLRFDEAKFDFPIFEFPAGFEFSGVMVNVVADVGYWGAVAPSSPQYRYHFGTYGLAHSIILIGD